jgi:hypothetical protein
MYVFCVCLIDGLPLTIKNIKNWVATICSQSQLLHCIDVLNCMILQLLAELNGGEECKQLCYMNVVKIT